jgi:hypothetical protein
MIGQPWNTVQHVRLKSEQHHQQTHTHTHVPQWTAPSPPDRSRLACHRWTSAYLSRGKRGGKQSIQDRRWWNLTATNEQCFILLGAYHVFTDNVVDQ